LSNYVVNNNGRKDDQGELSIVFLGRRCQFSTIPFQRLIDAGIRVTALFLASNVPSAPAVRLRRSKPSITILGGPGTSPTASIEQIAGKHAIPVYDVRRPLKTEFAATLREFTPDLLVSSCFPWRIPTFARDEARLGGINLHPSLLPRFRGPDPLFWTYYYDEQRTGVTIHRLNDTFDAGTILAQTAFDLPDEIAGDELEALSATYGAELLVDVIAHLNSGKLNPEPQDEKRASYQSWPTDAHLIIDRNWPMQRVLNFVAGVIPLGYAPRVATSNGTFVVGSARRARTTYESDAECWSDESTVCIAFSDGRVEFTLEK